jgi:hypothetical protein
MADAAPAPANTSIPTAPTAPKSKKMKVVLRNAVWIDDPDNPGQTIRLDTQIKQQDENGRDIVDQKTGEYVTVDAAYDLDEAFAKRLLKNNLAYFPDVE